ncbi:glycosyltransferase [Candidatus Aminicenantes bacterium AC-334-K16]|nr:glycosyltransferase [Candidatus Aminicenantes bacterium AC-334-K16]
MSLFQIDAGKGWRGGQRQSLLLCRLLLQQKFPCYLVAQPGSPLARKAREEGIPVITLRMRGEADFWAATRLALILKRKKCQLIHYHDAHAVMLGALASRIAKVPLRVLTRRVDFPLNENLVSRWKYQKNIDAFIAVSTGVQDVLVKGGIERRKIYVVPDGIDFTPYEENKERGALRVELNFSPDDYVVGIVAHLADHKGHKYLIEAIRLLKEKLPQVRLIIVGEGPLKLELSRQVKDFHLEDVVFFLGFREDIPRILASLDLFVLSSHLEGLGSSLLEAMASRLPVVATRVGGIPDVVIHQETGLLVPPKNPPALAEAILDMYTHRERARQMGQKGYEVVHRKFSAEAMASRVIDVYQRLFKGKNMELNYQNGSRKN